MAERQPAADGATTLRARALFLVWAERHRGTRSAWLAESLGVEDLRYLSPTRRRGLRAAWQKYPIQLVASLRVLLALRPRVVLVQSPPSFAARRILPVGTESSFCAMPERLRRRGWRRSVARFSPL